MIGMWSDPAHHKVGGELMGMIWSDPKVKTNGYPVCITKPGLVGAKKKCVTPNEDLNFHDQCIMREFFRFSSVSLARLCNLQMI